MASEGSKLLNYVFLESDCLLNMRTLLQQASHSASRASQGLLGSSPSAALPAVPDCHRPDIHRCSRPTSYRRRQQHAWQRTHQAILSRVFASNQFVGSWPLYTNQPSSIAWSFGIHHTYAGQFLLAKVLGKRRSQRLSWMQTVRL